MQTALSSLPSETLETLRWATQLVRDLYGDRLQHLLLFGSYARGEATPESDVDLLVVLDGPVRSYDEAKRTSRIATRAAAYRDTALSFTHLSVEDFSDHRRPLVRSVREEGIDLLEVFSSSASSEEALTGESR
jgi:predicted nucleotidyltransferase